MHNNKKIYNKNQQNLSTNTELYNSYNLKFSYFTLEKVLGHRKARFINKLEYWIQKCGRNVTGLTNKWIYNALHAWAVQLNCSVSTIRRVVKSLENEQLLFSKKINAPKCNHTKWYSINNEKLISLLNNHTTAKKPTKLKWTDRTVQNEQINNNSNNYTIYISSNKRKRNNLKTRIKIPDSKIQKRNNFTEQEHILLSKMVISWNNVFIYSLSPIRAFYNDRNGKQLLLLLKTKFKSSLILWTAYAKRINSSQFLMGEKSSRKNFKAVFHWLIKTHVVDEIIAGAYGVGDRELDIDRIAENIKAQEKRFATITRKKLYSFIKTKINGYEEEKEFIEYIKKNTDEEDQYGLNSILKHYDRYGLLHFEHYSGLRKTLYDRYLMKKYTGYTNYELESSIKRKLTSLKSNNCSNKLFVNLQSEIYKIQTTIIDDKQSINILF